MLDRKAHCMHIFHFRFLFQVIYEGSSIIHGRPYPFHGQTYSEIQLHFEPVGYSQRHTGLRQDPKKLFEAALQKQQDAAASGGRPDDETWKQKQKERPYYVPPKYEDQWEQKYVYVKRPTVRRKSKTIGSSGGGSSNKKGSGKSTADDPDFDESEYEVDGRLFHNLAAKGFLVQMKELVTEDPTIVTKADANGWLALHEAARSGHTRGE